MRQVLRLHANSNRERPADIFASADLDWMDYSSQKKTIKDDTRVNLLGNKLVLIAPKDSKIDKVEIGPDFDLAKLIGDGRIATGEVSSVPVGKYAKGALEKLGIWASVQNKFAMADNVRAAMALVSRGEAVLGIVYETDAKVDRECEDRRRVSGRLASADHVSGGRDRERQAGGRRLSQLPAQQHREGRIRAIRLHLPGAADILMHASSSSPAAGEAKLQ